MSTAVARKEGKVSAKRSPKKLETESSEPVSAQAAEPQTHQVVKKVKAAKSAEAAPAGKSAEAAPAGKSAEAAAAKAPVRRAKKASESSEADASKSVPEDKVESKEAGETAAESEQTTENGSKDKLSRKKKTYHQLVSELDNLNQLLERYVSEHKDQKVPGLSKFLKDLEKGIKKARFHVQKIGKNKSSSSGQNSQSGFQKPVRISEAVSRFTGWDVNEPRARVDVTNYVCEYIKRNDLQSPKDKRVILADEKLRDLLEYQSERDGDLTYATIQKLLAKHYTSIAAASA